MPLQSLLLNLIHPLLNRSINFSLLKKIHSGTELLNNFELIHRSNLNLSVLKLILLMNVILCKIVSF